MSMERKQSHYQKNLRLRMILAVVLAIIFAGAVAFAVYVNTYYHGESAAVQAMASDEVIAVYEMRDGVTIFTPEETLAAFIFYPGGKGGAHRLRAAAAGLRGTGDLMRADPYAL